MQKMKLRVSVSFSCKTVPEPHQIRRIPCLEVRPSVPGTNLPIHSMMVIQYGVHLLENLKLEKLAGAQAYEFAFIMQPLKLKGATGSNVAPVAIH
jgi:kynurenine formamidase